DAPLRPESGLAARSRIGASPPHARGRAHSRRTYAGRNIVSIIEVSRRGEVSVVLLNRPDRLNAFDGDMTTALMAGVSEAENDPDTKAIVITGAGRAFSAGGDVRSFGTNVDTRVNRRGWHLANLMLRVEKPTIAMVNGAAVGLGLTVALLCDAAV